MLNINDEYTPYTEGCKVMTGKILSKPEADALNNIFMPAFGISKPSYRVTKEPSQTEQDNIHKLYVTITHNNKNAL